MDEKKVFLFLLSLGLISCNSSGSGSTPLASTASVDTSEMAEVLGGVFDSIGSTDFGAPSSKIKAANIFFTDEAQSSEDPNCSNKGRPWSGSSPLPQGEAEYSNLQFRCLSSINSNSPETIQGVLTQAKDFTCALAAITGLPISFPPQGEDPITREFLNANLTTTGCFADTSELPTDVSGTVTYTTLDSSITGFEEKITLNITDMDLGTPGDQSFVYEMLFFNENNRMGLKTIEQPEDSMNGAGASAQVLLDLNDNIIFYNYIDDRARSAEDYRTFTRMKMKVSIDANFNITGVTEGTGIHITSGPNKDENYSASTIRGNQTTGFKSRTYSFSNNPSDEISVMSENCTDGTCTGLFALAPADTTEASNVFMGNTSAWSYFIQNGTTLCSDADVAFTATPTTGILGVCLSL